MNRGSMEALQLLCWAIQTNQEQGDCTFSRLLLVVHSSSSVVVVNTGIRTQSPLVNECVCVVDDSVLRSLSPPRSLCFPSTETAFVRPHSQQQRCRRLQVLSLRSGALLVDFAEPTAVDQTDLDYIFTAVGLAFKPMQTATRESHGSSL